MNDPSLELLAPTFRSLGLTVLQDEGRLLVSGPNATTTEIAFAGDYAGLEWRSAGVALDRRIVDLSEPLAAVEIKKYVLDCAQKVVVREAA